MEPLNCKVKKRTLKDWVELQVFPAEDNSLKELQPFLSLINVTECTLEDAMHFKQMQQAVEKGDSRAYSAIMDMLYGKKITEEQDKSRPLYAIYPADSETARIMEEI